MRQTVAVNYVLAFVGVLGVSASGPLMAATQAPALAIAFWRNALASVALAPVAAATRRVELRGLTRTDVRVSVFAGLMLACHFAAWVTALKLTSVAAAIAMVCTQIGWIVLIDRLRGQSVARAVLLGLVVSFSGVLVVSGVDLSLSPRALTGDLLGLLGGLFAAFYTISGSRARQNLSTTTYTLLCYGVCATVLLVVCLASGTDLAGFSATTWLGLVAVTVFAQLLGHSVFNHLLAVMSPALVSLILLLEVPVAALLAGIFLGQTPAVGVYVGLALILGGLAIVVTRRPPSEAEVALNPAD